MKLDKRRKYYMILDCETATLPFASQYNDEQKKRIAIAKPLIYDIGWQIIDRKGNVYSRQSYLVSETFLVPNVFDTAYYKDKRPLYLTKLANKEITIASWKEITDKLVEDLSVCHSVGAYNSMFDFKKAIPFTEEYINHLFDNNYSVWEDKQKLSCDQIANNVPYVSNKVLDKDHFNFRNVDYDLFDVWGMACEFLLDNDDYRQFCTDNNLYSSSGQYYSTTAENCYRFLKQNVGFIESHTAIEDSEIETEIFAKIVEKHISNLTLGITYFPFKMVGKI